VSAVATRKAPSSAVSALLAEVKVRSGLDVSPRQFERWRQAGAFDLPDPQGLGRHRGTRREYPVWIPAHAAALASLVEEHRNLENAILRTFIRRWPVPERGIKAGFEWFFDHAEEAIRREINTVDPSIGDDIFTEEAAEAAGAALVRKGDRTRAGRVMRRNVKRMAGRQESVDSVLASAYSNAFSLLLVGRSMSDEGMDELIGTYGHEAENPETRSRMEEGAARMMLPVLRIAAQNATRRELEFARDVAQLLVEGARETVPTRGVLEPTRDWKVAAQRMWALGEKVMGEMAVALHTPMGLILFPMLGVTIEQAHAHWFGPEAGEGSEDPQ
jgi:hypothetical protein